MSGPTGEGATAGAEGSAPPGGAAARTRGGAGGRRAGGHGAPPSRRGRTGRPRAAGFAGELWPRRDGGRADLGTGCAAAASVAVLGLVVVYVLRWWLLAFLVSAVVALGVAAAVVGGSVLTGLYFRRTHEVMFGGGRPEDPPPGEGDDPAHRAYHGGPAWWDLRTIVGRTWAASALWGVLLGAHFAVHALVVAAYLAAAWTFVGVLRVVDAGLLVVRRVRMVCPGCFLRLGYPAYLCTRCGRRHGAIRPGLRGLLRRRCLCGARLPTLLLLGSADLDALCPHCDRGLEHRPGEAREFVLPLFGSAGAGKTRLVAGMNLALAQAARGTREAYVEPVGEETVRRLRDSERLLTAAHRTGPTPPGREVRGLTVRVGAEGRTLLLQVYDAAGERFNRSATTEELTYLGQASTFVLVVDPLGVEAVWRSMTAGERSRLSGHRSRVRDPELAYGAVRDEIRRQYRMSGRRLRPRRARTRLAVVVTRGDLVRGTSAAPGGMPPEEWAARTLGLGNLLRDAAADFGEVRVFLTASVADGSGTAHPSLSALLRWVLAGESAAFAGMLAGSAPGSGTGTAPRGAPVPLGSAPPRPERVGGGR
ncbi:TRAFAC clade GTPase domain-containing protein [Nocardiopsis tropica]|uniref:Double-GTPase 2 domain-containing protein n=1 Tax=Nocardiopsis tropica TaxID=109330 RepID=A0ABV1ZRE8_9ACTN